MKKENIENRTVGLNSKPLEPRSNKRLYQYGALFVAVLMVFSSIGYATIKLGEDGSGQKWFGADPSLITNSNGKAWTATGANIQLAVDDLGAGGGVVTLPFGYYHMTETVNITDAVLVEGLAPDGGMASYVRLIWDGSSGGIMFNISGGGAGATLRNLRFDGNKTADTCVIFYCPYGSSLQDCAITGCYFKDYTGRGLVLGSNSTTINNAQLAHFYLEHCRFVGGVNGSIGVYSNAQNLEYGTMNNVRFDVAGGFNHSYHLYNKYGCWIITGMTTARSNVYAIYTNARMTISGWNAEEANLLITSSAAIGNIVINSLLHRGDAFPSSTAINYNGKSKSSLVINSAFLTGDVFIGATDERHFSLNDVYFTDENASLVFSHPKNQYGTWSHNGTVKRYSAGVETRYELNNCINDVLQLLGNGTATLCPCDMSTGWASGKSRNSRALVPVGNNVEDFEIPPASLGLSDYYTLNGSSEYFYVQSSTGLSFGNSVTDNAFSLVIALNMDAGAYPCTIAGKYYSTTEREWIFRLNASGYPEVQLFDESTDGYIGRQNQSAVTADTWYVFVITYNGSGTSAGINIYKDGVDVDDVNYESGVYTAMENFTRSIYLGVQYMAAGTYYDGSLTWFGLVERELSPDDAWTLTRYINTITNT